MKLLYRLVVNTFGYGFVLNQFTLQCLESISQRRETCLLLKNLLDLLYQYGKHTVYTDGGTWYDEACNMLGLKHYLHSSIEKSLMERVNQYLKDRIECFDDYYPCRQIDCNLFHVHNWIQFFVTMYNDKIANENEFVIQLQSEVVNLS